MTSSPIDPRPPLDLARGAPTEAPDRPLRGSIPWDASLFAHVQELVRHHELLLLVTQRELKVRYKQTTLGVLWAVLQPLSLMLVFTLFFSIYAGLPSDGIPYPLFSYAGLLPWTFFAASVSFAVPSLIHDAHIITKTYFPREIVPLASVLAAFVDFSVAAALFVVMMALYGVVPALSVLYLLPLLALQVVFTIGVCLLFSAITVVYRDARFAVPLLVQLTMFATPVLYPVSVVPESVRLVYLIVNPLASIVDGYRRVLLLHQSPELGPLASAAAWSLALLWLAYWCFKRLERQFADLI
jgi:lipopolysaccharide transport system permease protein